MRLRIYSFIITLCLALASSSSWAAVYTSVQNGLWSNKNTWDKNGTPKNNDIVIINHNVSINTNGASISDNITIQSAGNFIVNKSKKTGKTAIVTIIPGGIMTLNANIEFSGLLTNNGTINGTANLIFKGGTLEGTGVINTFGFLDVTAGLTILTGAFQTVNNGNINAGAIIQNFGTIDLNGNLINAGGSWTNEANSLLQIEGDLFLGSPGLLTCSSPGNTVEYDGPADQDINDPVASTYTNLTIDNAGNKTLQNNTIISNNLTLEGGTLVHDNGTMISNINLSGDWLNTGGYHDGTNGIVYIESTAIQTISHTWGDRTETFYQLFVNGASVKTLNAHLLLNDYMEINSTVDVSLSDFQIELKRDFVINGTLMPQTGLVKMSGTVPQIISTPSLATFYNLEIDNATNVTLSTGNFDLRGTLSLTNGMFNTNNAITLVSDGTFQGNVGEITGGDINGDITLERYIPAGNTDWRMLATGISGATLTDWSLDFITTGIPGSQYPNFPFVSIYEYDETVLANKDIGWIAPASMGASLGAGKGYFCYVGDGQYTTNALKLNVTGPINKNDITIPLSYTLGGPVPLLDDGWNLIGNPYPSSINWDSPDLSKNNIYDVYYIWDPSIQNFAYHVGGPSPVSGNGGSNIIGSSQAIWVQTFANPASLVVKEKTKNSNDSWKSVNYNEVPLLNVKIIHNNFWDETKIRFIDDATENFDPLYDAKKLFSTNSSVPGVSTIADGLNLAVNTYSLNNGNITIPIKTYVENSGNATLEFNYLAEFPLGSCIVLEDLHTGNTYDIIDSPSLTIFLSDTNTTTHRFELTVSKPIEKEITNVSCNGMNDGSVDFVGHGNGNWDYKLTDLYGNIESQESNSNSNFSVSNLTGGEYIFEITNNDAFCSKLISDTIFIHEPEILSIANSIATPKCFGEDNGSIDVNISGGTAPYQVVWNNGNTTFNNQNLTSGNYSLKLSDYNNCIDSANFIVEEGVYVEADFQVLNADQIVIDNPIQFENNSVNADVTYWEFGQDYETSMDTNPLFSYNDTGYVSIKLYSMNGSCMDSMEVMVYVNSKYFDALDDKDFFYFQDNNNLNISLLNSNEECLIYTISGQLVNFNTISKTNSMLVLNKGKNAAGIYLVLLIDNTTNTTRTGKIYIE